MPSRFMPHRLNTKRAEDAGKGISGGAIAGTSDLQTRDEPSWTEDIPPNSHSPLNPGIIISILITLLILIFIYLRKRKPNVWKQPPSHQTETYLPTYIPTTQRSLPPLTHPQPPSQIHFRSDGVLPRVINPLSTSHGIYYVPSPSAPLNGIPGVRFGEVGVRRI